MPKMSKQRTTFIVVLVCIGLILGIKIFKQIFCPDNQSSDSAQVYRSENAPIDSDKVKGSENAPVKIIEYVDFQCPSCAQGAKFMKNFMTAHLGQVQIELKHFPLAMHQHGLLAAKYAECASRQGKFWDFHDLVFELQDQWKTLADAAPTFDAVSQEIGLDMTQVKTCLLDENVDRIIEQDRADGKQRGVRSTPSYFVNGEMAVGTKMLEQALNRSGVAGNFAAMRQGSAGAVADEFQSGDPKVKASHVCMPDDKYFGRKLVPVEINGKTYYACCQKCGAKLRLEAARYGADPMTGESVDKADAYIVLKQDGSNGVFYFKSVETYSKYIEKNEVK